MKRLVVLVTLAACGTPAPPATPAAEPPPARAPREDQSAAAERLRRQELATAHHKLEVEQQDALAATCADKQPGNNKPRCLPSCYATELPDPRAGKKLPKRAEVVHLVCEAGAGSYVVADEILGAKRAVRPARGRKKPHKKTTWQGAVELALAPLGKRDVVVVAGTWRPTTHPITKERLRCVNVSRFTTSPKLDGCGGDGSLGCEAIGDAAARGINVVHHRLAEARRLQTAGKQDECQQAALEAVAVARGMPRWRQYAKLNVDQWVARGIPHSFRRHPRRRRAVRSHCGARQRCRGDLRRVRRRRRCANKRRAGAVVSHMLVIRELDPRADRPGVEAIDTSFQTSSIFGRDRDLSREDAHRPVSTSS